uniref:Short coiled-coil protein n=1 Tax=Astatotilapia calliptera TaxID=8154 RepID=A0AAX7VS77_ASTCA
MSSEDGDMENQAELEEKTRLINQVLELQHTLEDLSARVDAVKEENLKLKSENQVLEPRPYQRTGLTDPLILLKPETRFCL